jgi:hypothetical protein
LLDCVERELRLPWRTPCCRSDRIFKRRPRKRGQRDILETLNVRPRFVLSRDRRRWLSDLPALSPRPMRGSKCHRWGLIEITELKASLDLDAETICVLSERECAGTVPPELAPADIETRAIQRPAPSNVPRRAVRRRTLPASAVASARGAFLGLSQLRT